MNGLLYIYEVDVGDPVSAVDKVADGATTQEHWVTTEVLARAAGSVPVRLVGSVNVGERLRCILKIALHGKKILFDAEEEKAIWDVVDGLWVPRFEQAKEIPTLINQAKPPRVAPSSDTGLPKN
jgi:hypothetical protein